MKQLLTRWLPPILWMSLLFAFSSFSSLPGPEQPWWNFLFKKAAHVFVYAVLFFLWQRAINWQKPFEQHRYWQSFVLTIAYACFDEWHQSWVPLRHPSVKDIVIDSFGALISFISIKYYQNIRSALSPKP